MADTDENAQLTAGAYETFIVMVAYDYSNVMTQAPSAFQSAEAIRAAISIARLLGMVFSDCGGAGHWERARELLRKREYVVCVLAELDKRGQLWKTVP